MDKEYWVAVGSNGVAPVVWGAGENQQEALNDANRWLGDADKSVEEEEIRVYQCSEQDFKRIAAGDFSPPKEKRQRGKQVQS